MEANDVVTLTAEPGGPGFSAALDSLAVPTIVTAPPSCASVYAPASYTVQTASVATVLQNSLGYDAQYVAYFQGAASVAAIQIGTGPTNPPHTVTVTPGITVGSGGHARAFPAYVPAGYYYSFQVTQANGASVLGAALTVVAYPV